MKATFYGTSLLHYQPLFLMTTASLSTLRELKLGGMADAYEAVLATPLNQQPEAHELIARLADAERQNRQRRRMELNLRLSKLRYAVTLQDVDCSATRNLSKNQLAVLSDVAGLVAAKTSSSPELPAAASRT
jgi:hypothetical protein